MRLKNVKKLLVFLVILVLSIPLIVSCIKKEKHYREAKTYYQETCKYVKENEQAFMSFSEYATTLLDMENSRIDLNTIDAWNKHTDGKIVQEIYNYIAYACIATDGTKVTYYIIKSNPGYEIHIIYKKNIYLEMPNLVEYKKEEEYCLINHDLFMYFTKDWYGRNY